MPYCRAAGTGSMCGKHVALTYGSLPTKCYDNVALPPKMDLLVENAEYTRLKSDTRVAG